MITFLGETKYIRSKKRNIKSLLEILASHHKKTINSLNIVFVSDEELLEINRQSLSHDYYTDIITFDYSTDASIEGELYISIDRIKDNAVSFKEPFSRELLRVICHGVLHIVGYKDKTETEKSIIRAKENYYLKKYTELFHVEP